MHVFHFDVNWSAFTMVKCPHMHTSGSGSAKVTVQHGLLSQVGALCDGKDTLLSWNVLL